jgi:hypothetical protein
LIKAILKQNVQEMGQRKYLWWFNSFKRSNMLNSEQILNGFLVREEVVSLAGETIHNITYHLQATQQKLNRNYALYLNHTYSAFTCYFAGV